METQQLKYILQIQACETQKAVNNNINGLVNEETKLFDYNAYKKNM